METEQSERDAHDNDFVRVVQECIADSHKWFPDNLEHTLSLGNLGLCLAGEVGELCNVLKKIGRGSLANPFEDSDAGKIVRQDLAMEATDVLIYLMNFFGMIGVDPLAAYNVKRQINEGRFVRV